VLAISATMLGSIWHALWAGIPLGLCVIAFTPAAWLERNGLNFRNYPRSIEKQGLSWGLRERTGDPDNKDASTAWIDESNYYYIKVDNEPDADGLKRTIT